MKLHLLDAFVNTNQITKEDQLSDFVYHDGVHDFHEATPLSYVMEITRLDTDEFLIKGNASVILPMDCDRCTESVDLKVDVDFERSLDLRKDDEETQVNYVDGMDLDIIAFLMEEFLVEYPMKVLCSETCNGLCEKCGANLNEQECSCEKGHVDVRMAHLKDLFESKFKEV